MRMMQKMGMKVDELADVFQVVIRTPSKEIVIEQPDVTMVTMQGQTMYQIAGGTVSEAKPAAFIPTEPSDADIQIVAHQTGKGPEDAKRALVESGGDLARAILMLKQQTTQG